MNIKIRPAQLSDAKALMRLLRQVNNVHAAGRPDLFIADKTKYTEAELSELIDNPQTPIFVGTTDDGRVIGYCFCIIHDHSDSHILQPVKTLYIDDLCVDEVARGLHVGSKIYAYVKTHARENGFYNLTLNVWSCNPSAIRFYESLGLKPQKIGLETILAQD